MIKTPAEYGRRAFKTNKPCVPALDQEFLRCYCNGEVGTNPSALCEWRQGWISASLATPARKTYDITMKDLRAYIKRCARMKRVTDYEWLVENKDLSPDVEAMFEACHRLTGVRHGWEWTNGNEKLAALEKELGYDRSPITHILENWGPRLRPKRR